MIKKVREKYNKYFTKEKFKSLTKDVNNFIGIQENIDLYGFSATPIFLSDDLNEKLIKAGDDILKQLSSNKLRKKLDYSIPKKYKTLKETKNPDFVLIDFAISKNKEGFIPKLIELQGASTTSAFFYVFNLFFKKHLYVPKGFNFYYNNLNHKSFLNILKKALLGKEKPENVILLEIEPEKQKTFYDFMAIKKLFGIEPVCISKVIKKGNKLFYLKDDKEVRIKRIYSRVVIDELETSKINYQFKFTDDLDVDWVCHPNWTHKISKYALPLLKGEYVPKSFYLKDLKKYPENLDDYIMKPLFSFAGNGVVLDLDKSFLTKIKQKSNYLLQEKVEYAPIIQTLKKEKTKAEIRMVYFWGDNKKPLLLSALVRQSFGDMMNICFNKDSDWSGKSIVLHRRFAKRGDINLF